MKLKNLIISKTLLLEQFLTEEKVSAFISNCESRYVNKFRASRTEAAKYWSTKNIQDKILMRDDNIGVSRAEFRRLCILQFDKSKHKIPREDFIIILDAYLANYNVNGILI